MKTTARQDASAHPFRNCTKFIRFSLETRTKNIVKPLKLTNNATPRHPAGARPGEGPNEDQPSTRGGRKIEETEEGRSTTALAAYKGKTNCGSERRLASRKRATTGLGPLPEGEEVADVVVPSAWWQLSMPQERGVGVLEGKGGCEGGGAFPSWWRLAVDNTQVAPPRRWATAPGSRLSTTISQAVA
jgi:hypothetical protein